MFEYQALLESWLGYSLRPNSKGEVTIRCLNPDHHDTHPSLSLNCESGLWHCFGCGLSGNIYRLAQLLGKTIQNNEGERAAMDVDSVLHEAQEIADSAVSQNTRLSDERKRCMLEAATEFYHRQFINAKKDNSGDKYLLSKKITRRMVVKYRIGLAYKNGLSEYLFKMGYALEEQEEAGLVRKLSDGTYVDTFQNSVIFPVIRNGVIEYIVARQLAEGAKPKYLNMKGAIKWLYNEDVLVDATGVIIAEGIPDTLTLIEHNFCAVGSLGAGLLKQEFKEKFHNVKTKYVCYDNDIAGREGVKNVSRIFDGNVKVITLPDGIKDIGEFFKNHDASDFKALVEKAKWFTNYELDHETEKDIHLIDVESSDNIEKRVRVVFRIAGVGAAYFVPVRFRVYYKIEDNEDIHSRWFTVLQNSVLLLKMCKESREAQLKDLQRFAMPCLGSSARIERIEITNFISVTQLIALPKIKELKMGASGEIITEEGKEYRQKVVYFQGVKNTTSKIYSAKGYVLADPKTSEARFLVSDYEEIKEEFDKFRLTQDVVKRLEQFKRKASESIDEYLDKLAESAAYYFIRIYGEARKDAIIANLLCFHSPLYFRFENEIVPGWLQIIFLGDTTTGKSKISGQTGRYINVGIIVTGETCSRTGFLYCIDTKTLSACTLTWGLLPQQDRSILIIDGANYISPEDWGTAREARRSGKLIIERVVKGEHPCRTRLVLIANPPKPLNQYIYPIEALKDVHQDPDIARTDMCVCFMNSDVPKEEINIPQEERSKPEMDIDQDTLQQSVFWAFSRKAEDIIISDDVTKVINDAANRLLDKFGAATDIPLVTNDVKYKVARISVALASLLHSTNKSHEKAIVTVEIVEAVERFIERVYSAPNCRFDQYALDKRLSTDITSDEFNSIQKALAEETRRDRSNILTEMIGMFRSNNIIRLNEISARLDKSDSTIKSKLVFFKRFGLIRSGKSGYAKTEKFIQFLNRIEQEKKALPSLPPYGKTTPQQ